MKHPDTGRPLDVPGPQEVFYIGDVIVTVECDDTDKLKLVRAQCEAAPDLLEACKALKAALGKYVTSERWYPADLAACQLAVAALKKAGVE